jgi:hypothetical protein
MTVPGGSPQSAPGQADDAQALRAALRHGLATALKARDRDALAALRTAIAAIDNAQAVPAPGTSAPGTTAQGTAAQGTGARIAGARSGAGSTEAPRRQLGPGEVRDILLGQIAEHASEAGRYDALGQGDAAERLRRQARTLAAYVR